MKAILKALRTLGEVLGKNKGLRLALVYGAAGIALFAGIMAGLNAIVGGGSGGSGQGAAEQPRQEDPQADADERSAGSAETTEDQVARSYQGTDADVVNLLCSYSWTDGTRAVSFTASSAQTAGGDSGDATVPYVVERSHDGGSESQTFTDGATSTVTKRTLSFILELDGTSYPAYLSTITQEDGSFSATLVCDGLSSSPLASASSSNELVLSGDDSALATYVGGSTSGLQDALRTWASKNAPAATQAEWDGVVTIDTESGLVTFALSLDGASTTRVSVTYTPSSGSFAISATR